MICTLDLIPTEHAAGCRASRLLPETFPKTRRPFEGRGALRWRGFLLLSRLLSDSHSFLLFSVEKQTDTDIHKSTLRGGEKKKKSCRNR